MTPENDKCEWPTRHGPFGGTSSHDSPIRPPLTLVWDTSDVTHASALGGNGIILGLDDGEEDKSYDIVAMNAATGEPQWRIADIHLNWAFRL